MSLYINDKTTGTTNLISGSERPDTALDETSKNSVQNKVIAGKINEIEGTINEIKKSVSDGKSKVASAITDRGVATQATDTFDIMAENVRQIQTGISLTQIIGTSTVTSNYGDIKTIATHKPYVEE